MDTSSQPLLSPRFSDALLFAAELHATQPRKGTAIPYISHLMAVASLVLEHGGTEDEAIAALLHDAIGDQGVNYEGGKGVDALRANITDQFGDSVTDIVNGCTDAEVDPKPPWRARKEAYIAHLRHASDSVLLVSLCDKLHNVRAILMDLGSEGDAVFKRFTGGKKGTLWYYRALVDAFRQARAPAALVNEFDRTVGLVEKLLLTFLIERLVRLRA
jgi:(p)ppGpp synthase/HD superfamily hydrolase